MKIGILISISLVLLGITFIILSFKCITSKWALYIAGLLFVVTIILFIIAFKGVILI